MREEEGEPSDAEILMMMMIFNCLPEHNEGYPVLSIVNGSKKLMDVLGNNCYNLITTD